VWYRNLVNEEATARIGLQQRRNERIDVKSQVAAVTILRCMEVMRYGSTYV
jgi:hypothetical protein